MKLNKKLKYVLGSVGLAGLAIIPASVGLVSCSKKEEADNIVYYQDAQGAIFEGQPMQEGEYPFKCDFNITQKTCAIVDWITNEPNYMTIDESLPLRDGLGSETLHNKNNTIRIPSQIIYNGEEFSVVAFATFKGDTNNTYKLDLNKIDNYLIQVIEFDVGLTEINEKLSIDNSGAYINFEAIRQPNLLKVWNYPEIGMDLSGSEKLNKITFNPKKASYPNLENCISLTNIDIPSIETSNGWFIGGFNGCTSLKTVTISEGATEITSKAFKGCTSLTSITIPNSVTCIGNQAFEGCSSLVNITIPDSVTSIGYNAFEYCSSLTSINIPEGVTSIRDYAFYGCSKLTTINIPNSITSIGDSAFENCSSLTSINIPEGVTSIGIQAFESCSRLTNITIPNTVTSIGYIAFENCSSLESITIPESVNEFGDNIFKGSHTSTFKIYFHSEEQMKLFQSTNSNMEQYCEVISN